MAKSTEELRHEIKSATDIEDYLKSNRGSLNRDSLPRHLKHLLSEKGISKADVARDSLLDRTYTYQIFSGKKNPSRNKLISLAFGLHLSDEETQTLLKISVNRELYAKDARDAVILFALQHGMSVFETNELLFKHGFEVLGLS